MIRQIIQYSVILLILAVLIGLLSLNYIAVTAVIIGAVIAWPLVWLVRFVIANWSRIMLPVILVLSLAGCFLYGVYLFPLFLSPSPLPPLIRDYQLTILNPDWKSGVFKIKESVVINPDWISYYHATELPQNIDLPEREVRSIRVGLLSREVRIKPGNADASGEVTITLADGRVLQGGICSFSCGKIDIELQDAPAGSFLGARDADKIKDLSDLKTETISWSVPDPDQGITFAFVPPSFNVVRPIIKPLLGVSALNQWLLGILGLFCALLITPIFKPPAQAPDQNIPVARLYRPPAAITIRRPKQKPDVLIPNTGKEEADIFGLKKKR